MYATEWSIGNKNLNTSNPLYLWVYIIVSPLSDHDPKQYVKFPDYSSQILCKFIWRPFVPLLKLFSELLAGLLFQYGKWAIHTALLSWCALSARLKNPRKQKGISPRNFFPRWYNFELLLEKWHECDIVSVKMLTVIPAILFLEKCITSHQGFCKFSPGFRQPLQCFAFGILNPPKCLCNISSRSPSKKRYWPYS